MSRDPRVNPKPGDVLIAGPQWQQERYEVRQRIVGAVLYSYWPSTALHAVGLDKWADWMESAEVVKCAD